MKKIYLAVFLACSIGGTVNAQVSEGGLPWSKSLNSNTMATQQVSKLLLSEPDYAQLAKQDEADGKAGGKYYRAATMVKTDIGLNNSGTWTYLDNGKKVWRLKVEIPGAKAIDFHWDKFTLPEGVRLYITNENGKQILGAYTNANNNDFSSFTIEEVQGNVALLEMDIEAGIDVASIPFHISKSGAYYRGVQLVNQLYSSNDDIGAKPTDFGDASPCHVNANCPQGDGFPIPKNATVRVLIVNESGAGFCSGTLINNTGNVTGGNCKPLVLLASHCDGENGRDDAHFSGWKFAFDYMYNDCAGTTVAGYITRTGAKFRARSKFPSFAGNSAVGDFLLLELNNTPPSSTNPYLAGWNRDPSINNNEDFNFFIGFHHPAGDAKKVSTSSSISNATFNQTFEQNTHWQTNFTVGGSEGGSSGSGLFDKNGYLIGDLSGGPDGIGSCAPMNSLASYSKISHNWENTFDQAAFPGAQSRLKDWLDPANTGMISLPPTKYDCSDMPTLGVKELENQLDGSISIYPNPVTSGTIRANVNLADMSDLTVTFYNVVGAQQGSYKLSNVKSGTFSFDLKNYANGVYLMKITTADNISTTKRVVIAR